MNTGEIALLKLSTKPKHSKSDNTLSRMTTGDYATLGKKSDLRARLTFLICLVHLDRDLTVFPILLERVSLRLLKVLTSHLGNRTLRYLLSPRYVIKL
jgi:hypothetical protein